VEGRSWRAALGAAVWSPGASVGRRGARSLPASVWLAAAFLSTGAALVVHIVARVSFGLSVLTAVGVIAVASTTVWRLLPPASRAATRQRVLIGIAAGLAATAAYDGSRLIAVTLVPVSFWPFDTLSIFGRLLVGPLASPLLAAGVGTAYHVCNGVGFAIAFTLLFRRPTLARGLVWAAGLELLMVSLYPGWLNLRALDEFAGVSVVGHIAYGATLGAVSSRLLGRAQLSGKTTSATSPRVP